MNESVITTAGHSVSLTLLLGKQQGFREADLSVYLQEIQPSLFNELGIIIPTIETRDDRRLPRNAFQLQVNDHRAELIRGLGKGEFWVHIPMSLVVGPLWGRSWKGRESVEPNYGSEAAILGGDESARALWADQGYATRDALEYVAFTVAAQLRRQAGELLTPELLEHYLTRLATRFPALVQVTRERFEPGSLVGMLQSKLRGGASIRDLVTTFESMLAATVGP